MQSAGDHCARLLYNCSPIFPGNRSSYTESSISLHWFSIIMGRVHWRTLHTYLNRITYTLYCLLPVLMHSRTRDASPLTFTRARDRRRRVPVRERERVRDGQRIQHKPLHTAHRIDTLFPRTDLDCTVYGVQLLCRPDWTVARWQIGRATRENERQKKEKENVLLIETDTP